MGVTTKYLCDNCGRDLTYTGNSVDYRTVLSYESKAPWYIEKGEMGGTDMMILPYPETKKCFCGKRCLTEWLETGEPARPAAEQEKME